jgi:sugar phosphate isomerase/epimerase
MGLALSTSWNAYRHTDARSMLFEIRQLGFRYVELSFNLTQSMLDEIPGIASDLGLKITSLHNYCPIPEGLKREEALPDCYSIASLSPEERNLAIKYTKRTIDTAISLGASAVVLHCGRVEIEDRTRELISLYKNRANAPGKFNELKSVFIKERSRGSGDFLNSALYSREELNAYSQKTGILLGIENRFYYREIPSFEETGIILNKFKGGNIFYWHDTGHAKIMQDLGLTEDKEYLKAYGTNLAGIHLHDVIGCLDHQPLGKGEVNFLDFKQYLKKDTLKVIEVHKPAASEDIKESRKLLEEVFDGVL